MPRLIVIKGADLGKQFDLDDEVVGVGRDVANTIRLHDTEASRKHAEFRRVDGGYHVVDLNSANGTFVNTRGVKESPLQPGDHLQIGQTYLVYTTGRGEMVDGSQFADQIRMIGKQDETPSAIIKTINEGEGSRLLSRPDRAGSSWLQARLVNLGVMYEATQAVSHILDVDALLERIMELTFRSIEADRGVIMIRNPESNLFEPKAIRYRDGVNRQDKISLSRTIMDYVLREKKGVLVSDAARDDRFSGGQSIVRFGIREAICVPMKGRHETLGVFFLDTSTSSKDVISSGNAAGKFTEDHLALAIALAHQAALAIEETRYHKALVDAERLAAIGQTIAALSHHIKNILQGLRSGSELLKMGLTGKDEEMLSKGWRIVEKNQGKIYDLVLDMLSYSKEREPNIEQTDLNEVVADVLELVKGRVEQGGIALETRLDQTLPDIPIDPEGIHRALLNIVGNAVDAVTDRENPHIWIQTLMEADGEWVRLIVMDNGPGIPAEAHEDVFKPFVSTKGAKGTGLGLPVSRKILREHGGDILLQTQVGKGTKFIFRLPMRSPYSQDLGNTMQHLPMTPPPPN